MTKKEVRNLMERINSYYSEFVVDDFKVSEWYEELKKYELQDVNVQFEKHLKNEEHGRFAPKLFFLTKYIRTVEEKQKDISYKVKCKKCGRIIDNKLYECHLDKCVLIASMVRDLKKYFDLDISRTELESYDEIKLYRTYNKYIAKMLACEYVSPERKEILKKCHIKDERLQIQESLGVL